MVMYLYMQLAFGFVPFWMQIQSPRDPNLTIRFYIQTLDVAIYSLVLHIGGEVVEIKLIDFFVWLNGKCFPYTHEYWIIDMAMTYWPQDLKCIYLSTFLTIVHGVVECGIPLAKVFK